MGDPGLARTLERQTVRLAGWVWNDLHGTEKLPKYGSELWELTFTTMTGGRAGVERGARREARHQRGVCDCELTAWKVTSCCDRLSRSRTTFLGEEEESPGMLETL